MFSKLTELAGFALVSVGLAAGTTWWGGLIFGGASLLLVGATMDDAAVALSARRGWGWARFYWHRRLLREDLSNEESGGYLMSPHPRIEVDPEMEAWASRTARARRERAKVHDRTPALSRHEPSEDDGLERLA